MQAEEDLLKLPISIYKPKRSHCIQCDFNHIIFHFYHQY